MRLKNIKVKEYLTLMYDENILKKKTVIFDISCINKCYGGHCKKDQGKTMETNKK